VKTVAVPLSLRILTCVLTITLTTGCGTKPENAADEAAVQMSQGRYDKAARTYAKGLQKARKDPALAHLRQPLEDGLTAAIKALLEQARLQAQAHDFAAMLRSVEAAYKYAPLQPDVGLRDRVAVVYGSKLVSLARTARVYKSMTREVDWATFDHYWGAGDWITDWAEWSAVDMQLELVSRTAETQDTQLIQLSGEIVKKWMAARAFRDAQREREKARDNGGGGGGSGLVGALIDIGIAGGQIWTTVEFQKTREKFEQRLWALLGQTPWPGDAGGASQVAASAPAADATAGAQATTRSRSTAHAVDATGSRDRPEPSAPVRAAGPGRPPANDGEDLTADLRRTP
jgi:hypothetical protein